jgi:Rha family phage regulatory protein
MNEILEMTLSELRAVGLTPHTEHGSKHIRVYWEHEGQQRSTTVSVSPSDRRSLQNAKAQVRGKLREDGLLGDHEPEAIESPRPLIKAGEARVSSLDIGRHFSRQHKDVLRSIDRIAEEVGPEFTERNFAPSDYVDASGRTLRAFDLTRDGFSFLVMGFTGPAAARWKVAYIEAFNAMEAELRRLSVPQDVADKIARLEGEMQALIDLSLEAPRAVARKPRFVRPSVIRRMRRLAA